MQIHLSAEAARYIESHLARGHCRSASEFVELVLRDLRRAETLCCGDSEAWLQGPKTSAAQVRDNDADARSGGF